MNLFFSSLLGCLSFQFVSCGICSEDLFRAFKKGFDLTGKCEDCRLLDRGVRFRDGDWTGFCLGGEYFFFRDWACRRNESDTGDLGRFVRIAEESCETSDGKSGRDPDEKCLKKYNSKECNGVLGRVPGDLTLTDLTEIPEESFLIADPRNYQGWKRSKKSFAKKIGFYTDSVRYLRNAPTVSLFDVTAGVANGEVIRTKTETTRKDRTSTKTTSTPSTTSTTSTPSTTSTTSTPSTTSTTSTPSTTSTTSTPSTTSTKSTASTTSRSPPTSPSSTSRSEPPSSSSSASHTSAPSRELCEENEFAYQSHCYFLKPYDRRTYLNDSQEIRKKNLRKVKFLGKVVIDSVESCSAQHPRALGLAVETKEENNFVLATLKRLRWYEKAVILTSGVRVGENLDEWRGWNTRINNNILNVTGGNATLQPEYLLYCVDPCKSAWYLIPRPPPDQKSYILCERPYNPKNVDSHLHERCLGLYRKSPCYNAIRHVSYCCARDDDGDLWFGCPDSTTEISSRGVTCRWDCSRDGFFLGDRPTCVGTPDCSAIHDGVAYRAPAGKHAVGNCPPGFWGRSSWYCGRNLRFVGKPDHGLCCRSASHCRDTDPFLNVWAACPSRRVTKRTTCPPGSRLKEALVEWDCRDDGKFNGSFPDYSKCNEVESEVECRKRDRYDREWTAAPGTTERKNCPPSFAGECRWKCDASGEFEGDEPDCSRCLADWMNEVSGEIEKGADHEEVMEMMEKYTEEEDLRLGYGHVLNLTSRCVVLFKKQNVGSEVSVFDAFVRSYSKILKNVAGDPDLWRSFSPTNRRDSAKHILTTTQNATFANLESGNLSTQVYNASLASFRADGFDLLVAYNPRLEGSKFPLENFPESDWQVEVGEVEGSGQAFAAMALAMNYSLASLMFPRGNDTAELEMNAPAVTFTVAASRNGEAVVQPNVAVRVSFRHVNKTRFPATRVIRRRLHKGERPSGVFNSTLCYFYGNSDWSLGGCSVTFASKERTNCTCEHLSTIGLLMSVHEYRADSTLETISLACSGVTIVSLVLALLVFCLFDAVKNERALIGKNLCFCLLLGHVMILTVMDKKFFFVSDRFCATSALMLHYVFTAAFAWMFVEGFHLYRMLVLVFDSDIEYRYVYLSIGYGVPFLVVAATEVVGYILQEQPYGQDELCWLKVPDYVWAFIGPVVVTTSINLLILIIAMKLAISSRMRREKSNFVNLKIWVKGWISLSTLLGVTWLFGLSYIQYDGVFAYAFAVFNGLQGFFIFLFRCVLSDQYKTSAVKKLAGWFSRCRPEDGKRSEHVKSETKLFGISGSKSSSGKTDSGYDASVPGRKESAEKADGLPLSKTKTKSRGELRTDGEIILKPPLSEAYLRNKLIQRNLSARRSNRGEGENWPELSYHTNYKRN